MERATIQVPTEIKKQIQDLRDRGGFRSEWEVIRFLLEIEKNFDSIEIGAFLELRAKMFQSFEKLKLLENSKEN